jgi:outer membrane receptor protein involved in Fe transport
MRKYLLVLLVSILTTCVAFAQKNGGRQITGKLLDAQTKEPLIGATIAVKGTTTATSASLDGSFKLNVPEGADSLTASYIGYISKNIGIAGEKLGVITLDPTSSSMSEVVVTANSIAIDRQTPIAVSSVGARYIEEKGAGAEFPELLKATPGVTVSRSGGGYGDSRIAIRGFNSNNLALLINGLPVNDPEAGKIFWNDWAGLSDVTTSMQVQRGLSASRVAVPSLGGTINISTKSLEREEGGTISQSIGSYNALKTAISYATGLTDKGWAASFLLSKSTGNGNAEGLNYTGYSYFANISKVINPSQTLSFNIMGASQTHGQRYTYQSIASFRAAPQGPQRWNSDYGYLNGQYLSAEANTYNKPLLSLNHSWTINSTSSLSTVLYASYGTGAAVYVTGKQAGLQIGSQTAPRTAGPYSPIDFDAIVQTNQAIPDGNAGTYQINNENDHKQYGLISTYKKKIGDVDLLAGIDLRTYTGNHFYRLDNLFGAQYLLDSADKNNPVRHTVVGDKINQNYQYQLMSEGAFAQAEYVKNDLSAFITLGANNTGNKKTDYFDYVNTNPKRESKWINFWGYQAKGGANYNIDNHNNVFANIGYVQKVPLIGTIFPNMRSTDINNTKIPEKLFSYELGYGYVSATFSANVNLYRSTYKDRSKYYAAPANQDGSISYGNINGINEVHQGIEVDAKFRPIKEVTLSGMLSVGDYHYISNSKGGIVTSDKPGAPVTQIPVLPLKGLKIGDFGASAASNAQTTAALGLDVDVLPKVTVGGNMNYYTHYYASYDMSTLTYRTDPATQQVTFDPTQPYHPMQMPDYSTFDLNVVFRFKLAGLNASFIGNVYNIFNTEYFTEGFEKTATNTASQISRMNSLLVNYGNGRIYMTTLKIKF